MILLLDECIRIGRKTSSTTDLFTGLVKPHLLVGYFCYYTSASPRPWVITKISYSLWGLTNTSWGLTNTSWGLTNSC